MASSSSDHDLISLLNHKIDQMSTQFVEAQNQIMGHLTTVERNQYATRPHFTRQRRDATGWKPRPRQEEKAPDILKPIGMVDIDKKFGVFHAKIPMENMSVPDEMKILPTI